MELNNIHYAESIMPGKNDALLVVDVQNDFMPDGSLPVDDSDKVVKGISKTMRMFFKSNLLVVLTQDWHPPDHKSFAGVYEGKKPFDQFEAPGIGPILWPDHCVQGTKGAEFHEDLNTVFSHAVIRKGYSRHVDSYSGFLENDRKTETGLDGLLKSKGIKRIFVCGLAMDYCAFFTAADGADKGYKVIFMTHLTKPVGAPENSVSSALEAMTAKGVKFIKSLD